MPTVAYRPTLRLRIALGLLLAAVLGAALHRLFTELPPWSGYPLLFGAALLLLVCVAWAFAAALMAPLGRLLRTLEGAVLSFRDGDFSAALSSTRRDEFGELTRLHGELGQAIREQRQHLAQRELLLDTVVQNTPAALVLTNAEGRIVYANLAARQLLGEGRSLEGRSWTALMAAAPPALQQAVADGGDTLFGVELEGSDETFHLLQRAFRLQGQPHRLHLFRRMTRELSREEVAAWKRVLRVISHELNNSLAPISSMAHSGAELLRRGQPERVAPVLATIGERARHLHGFIEGYALFAKLPAPRVGLVAWAPFVEGLRAQQPFRLLGQLPAEPGSFDAAQIEQALINLLKNAHEAGGPPDAVTLAVTATRQGWRFEVADGGPGMSETVLAQALLPFYSTKRSGTGLGLALAREIAEAHGGQVALRNGTPAGLLVSFTVARPAAGLVRRQESDSLGDSQKSG